MQDDWANLEKPYGSIFLSIPTVLDSSLAPEGHHILHIFTTSCIEDWKAIDGLYCVGDSCFPGQGVIAVAFSGIMCAHRVAADIGLEKRSPILDAALLRFLGWLRTIA
ncbi:hypothetical protein BHE74_00052049 [Ensete ventricosum]|uniref:Amine oxidase domain-containing protein n=1 Tax=Ensete ventricosum TaxID=4639 RepID=A0A426ZLE8_ENSVE|nr:hypothetical protein B296_00039733 [Ensete ventricosum]RWW42406.1 hypothetical protein BHE74_00052049 [Ensete ventricosum]RZR78902.1 hypothetical protein BHM03_00004438 [Ensete ventricosum]